MPQNKPFTLSFGNQKLPLDIHHLAVDAGGRMVGIGKRRFTFSFVWLKVPFFALYEEEGETARIELAGHVGLMPFSAESARARTDLRGVMDAANRHLGEVFRLQEGLIELVGHQQVEVPVTAVGLVAALTRYLLRVKPYVDCMAVFIEPGSSRLQAGYRRGAKS